MSMQADSTPAAPAVPEALLASETRYRRLFEAAQDGILILDADSGKIIDANPFIESLLGYPHAYFVGKELWEIGLFQDAAASKVAFQELQDRGYIRYDDLPLETAGGQRIEVEFVSNSYLVDGDRVIQCNIRDITPRKRTEDLLRDSERLNRNLVEHLPHRILVKNRDSVTLFCNANYARDLGLPIAEVVGHDDFDFYPRELAAAYTADDREVMTSGVTKDIQEPYLVDGEERWVHTLKVPYRDEHGEVIGVLVVFEDITERRRLEEQSRQSQKMEAIGLLAGGVAHDFNNLLTVILGYCDLMSGRLKENDPLAADLEQIRACGERATALTRQLLAFSRKQVLAPQMLDLNALVSGLVSMLQRLIGEDIALRCVLAPDLGRIKADPGQVEQVVMNLVVNARDAMPSGGALTLETANVDLDQDYAGTHLTTRPGPHVMLAVTDTGSGMDEATRARVFEPFFTTKDRGQGTGLGLSTVHGIVNQSNGSVWCYSEPGKGTTFKVYLPRVDEGLVTVDQERPTASARGSETVLVAEDEELIRALIVQILTLEGYTVIATKDGAEAIRECETFAGRIDLLITDVVMPGISGFELTQRLAPIRPEMKVLFMSGYTGDAVLRPGALEQGAAFLQKPFTRAAFNRKIRDLLDA